MSSGSSATGTVRFGTSGWRGVLGDDFTFAGARAVARAVGEWARAGNARPRVVVAHDTRFLGERLADEVARVLCGAGVETVRAAGPVPTPVASAAVRRRRAAAGLLVTASHNPPEYQGLKVVGPGGGAAPAAVTRRVERRANQLLAGAPPPLGSAGGRRTDLITPYRRALLRRLDVERIRRARLRVVYDALHGTGSGVVDGVLRAAGVAVEVRRAEPDPRFGGSAPDPTPERLAELASEVRRRGCLGLATDGDADRFAVLDRDGGLLSETDALALLVDHLARSGRVRRGLAISWATGSLAEKVARDHGLPVSRHPIGFKHLTQALIAGEADVAGEESGGFAWAPLARDKDGILAACLLVELAAGAGGRLRDRLGELRRRHGGASCGRRAVAHAGPGAPVIAGLRRALPGRLDGSRVVEVCEADGLRVALEDGFLLWRASGTEPVLRLYAEAPGPKALERRLALGLRRLRAAAGRGG